MWSNTFSCIADENVNWFNQRGNSLVLAMEVVYIYIYIYIYTPMTPQVYSWEYTQQKYIYVCTERHIQAHS